MTKTLTSAPDHETPLSTYAERRRPFDLSATQLVATALAATTATVAASYLGVAGTVIGAALASVLTAIGNAVYAHSLRRTRERVRSRVSSVPGARAAAPSRPSTVAGATPDERAPELPAPRPVRSDAAVWRRVALGSVAVFVAVLGVITGVEIVAGRPLSDVVRGDSGQGTSLFGNKQSSSSPSSTTPSSTTTVTTTVTPKITVVTPTVTQTATAVTTTSTPTLTTTATATASTSAATSNASSAG